MSVSLTKGQSLNLNKDKPSLSKISMGLGWDMAKPKASGGGFLSKMFSSSEPESIDLDASCVVLDASGKMIDSIWFRQLKSHCGSIRHTGDNLTGEGDGDDETIEVDLSKVPASAARLVFLVNSFRGQTFDQVANAYCRLVDASDRKEMVKFDLSCQGKHTGQIMAMLVREGSGWKFVAVGDYASGRTFQDMLPQIQALA